MGLDGVEILLELEEEFGITVPDSVAGNVVTVKDLTELVRQRVVARDTTACVTLPAFLEARRATRRFLGNPQLRLRPSTPIAQVVPVEERKAFWREISGLHGTYLPPLVRPRWLQAALTLFALTSVTLGLMTMLIDPRIVILGVFGAAGAILFASMATAPFCVVPPRKMSRFGQLALHLAGVRVATQFDGTAEDVESRVRAILVKQLGVDASEVVPEARLVEDLRMD